MKIHNNVLPFTGERLVTQIANEDTIYHLHRYTLPLSYITNKVVVDIASGEGYGANLMAKSAKKVYGIDISKEAIDFATAKYLKVKNLSFEVGSVEKIPLDDQSADVVVSFETLEHTDKHEEMMSEIKRILKPEGVFIISSPDKANYSDQFNRINPFHVKELYFNDFKTLISKYFTETNFYYQKFVTGSFVYSEDFDIQSIKEFSGSFESVNSIDSLKTPFFNICICSNSPFKKLEASYFDGDEVIRNMYFERVMNFTPFRLGNFILKPFRILKKLLR